LLERLPDFTIGANESSRWRTLNTALLSATTKRKTRTSWFPFS
jgi:hypothetical protein